MVSIEMEAANAANSPVSRPSLAKIAAVDVGDDEGKKLSRGISRTAENAGIISQVRSQLSASLAEVEETPLHSNSQSTGLDTNDCTFTLPDLSVQSDEFRKFLEQELIDTSMSISLQEAGRLNWWTSLGEGCEKLWPLSTTGDGNCLLHAASLGMWGFHDRLLTLRKAMHSFLTTGACRQALWRRWRWQTARANAQAGLELFLSEDEWSHEWDNVLKLASSQPRTSGSSTPGVGDSETDGNQTNGFPSPRTYESLEEIHVLALAHVLKRPIIVIADTVLKDVNGEALAPITFGGIYLPLEIEASECSRSPLILAYDSAHFSALVVMKKMPECPTDPPAVIPLTDVDRDLLPIQFEVDPGETFVWNRDELNESVVQRIVLTHEDRLALLNQFLDLVDVPCSSLIKPPRTKYKGSGSLPRSNDTDGGWISDGEFTGGRGNHSVKSSKQFQSVAKQFGSLGRSMSRKIKKNFMDNFALKPTTLPITGRLNNSPWECPDFILCARLHTEKQHPCLEQMVANYLHSARQRFEQQQSERQRQTLVWQRRKQQTLAETALQEGPSPCINPNCNMYGTALTSYMCTACYAKQLEQEEGRVQHLRAEANKCSPSSAIYGAGKSVFYASSDSQAYADAAQIPTRKPPSGQNGTLFLSNSTFYHDVIRRKDDDPVVFEKLDNLVQAGPVPESKDSQTGNRRPLTFASANEAMAKLEGSNVDSRPACPPDSRSNLKTVASVAISGTNLTSPNSSSTIPPSFGSNPPVVHESHLMNSNSKAASPSKSTDGQWFRSPSPPKSFANSSDCGSNPTISGSSWPSVGPAGSSLDLNAKFPNSNSTSVASPTNSGPKQSPSGPIPTQFGPNKPLNPAVQLNPGPNRPTNPTTQPMPGPKRPPNPTVQPNPGPNRLSNPTVQPNPGPNKLSNPTVQPNPGPNGFNRTPTPPTPVNSSPTNASQVRPMKLPNPPHSEPNQPSSPPIPGARNASVFIRKPCRSAGCSQIGQSNLTGLCLECYHSRRAAAQTRDSILENMRAAQLQ